MDNGAEVEREEKAIHDIEIKLFHELLLGEQGNTSIELDNTLSKAVIIDAAYKVSEEVLPDTDIDNSEDDLEKVKNTGAIEAVTEVTEHDLGAG